ncbi:hypothetical protein [Streptomyces sp. NPDC102283]|uniref:hypothetical protein n=1 Tax=Streptomyces sp. NPDC102283 TaxID=3366155 RepID=UPI0038047624
MSASARTVRFGSGPWNTGAGDSADVLRYAVQADRAGLDLFTLSERPNVGGRFDAHAVLGGTSHLTGAVDVTNLPSRPVPMLARSIGARRDGSRHRSSDCSPSERRPARPCCSSATICPWWRSWPTV